MSQQNLDDAQARYDSAVAKMASLQKAYDLVKIGPRQEQIDAMRGQVEQAHGVSRPTLKPISPIPSSDLP